MAEPNKREKPAQSRKKTAWLIAAAAAGVVALLCAAALFAPDIGLLRAAAPAAEATAEPKIEPLSDAETPEAAAESEETPVYPSGYMRCENGLFRGADTITAGEAADAVLCAAGIELVVDDAAQPLTEAAFAALLSGAFSVETVESIMPSIAQRGGEDVTRAEAAVFFNRLFSLEASDGETAFYPDVIPGEWGSGDIYTAASGAAVWDGANGRPEEGLLLVDQQLYCVGEDGYFRKNAYSGSLYFDSAGRYTSGNAELDGLVLAALRGATDETMTRDEMLRAMYLYVRDSFSYLRRHYYKTGDIGWATQEALTMYSSGRGNCYCYAAAFWAAARALGYDAKIVSGTYGETDAPHGWVEILHDGERYTYDVEIEMAVRRDGGSDELYRMSDSARQRHGYKEFLVSDNMLPRSLSGELLPN